MSRVFFLKEVFDQIYRRKHLACVMHQPTRVDGERKRCALLAIKTKGTHRGGEGEEKPNTLRDPGSEF